MSDDDEQGDRGHRRQAAREKAQLARRRQKRRARGGRWAIQGGVAVLVIAVAIAVVVVVRSGNGASGATPRNMAGDGITIGRGLVAERTGAAASASTPSASSTAARSDTVAIDVYADYLCPICGSFEKTDTAYIRGLVKSGAATVTYHPVAILTSQSLGTKYSVRSANAAACVATYSPDAFFDFNAAMFAKQPAENTSGLSNTQLVSLVTGVDGITATAQIRKCITDETYASWVADATQRALSGPIPGARISKSHVDADGARQRPAVQILHTVHRRGVQQLRRHRGRQQLLRQCDGDGHPDARGQRQPGARRQEDRHASDPLGRHTRWAVSPPAGAARRRSRRRRRGSAS